MTHADTLTIDFNKAREEQQVVDNLLHAQQEYNKIDHANRKHSRISPSMLSRLYDVEIPEHGCLGSVALSRFAPEQPDSEAAKDGTLTHEVFDEVLKATIARKPHPVYLRAKEVDFLSTYDSTSREDRVAWSVREVLLFIQQELSNYGSGSRVLEYHSEGYSYSVKTKAWGPVRTNDDGTPCERLSIFTKDEHNLHYDVEGMVDSAACFQTPDKTYHVIVQDLKDGSKKVDATYNVQQLAYAYGYIRYLESKYDIKIEGSITIGIIQPKLEYAGRHTIPRYDLDGIVDDMLYKVRQAQILDVANYKEPKELYKHLQYDNSGCYFCRCKSVCPVYQETIGARQLDSFVEVFNAQGSTLPPLTEDQLERIVYYRKDIDKLLDAVEAHVLAEKQAAISNGTDKYPTLTIGESQTKTRWSKTPAELHKALTECGLKPEHIYKDPPLQSISVIKTELQNKILQRFPNKTKAQACDETAAILQNITERPKGKPTLQRAKIPLSE